MTKYDVLGNLHNLIGAEFDYNEVVCAFEDFEEEGVNEVIVNESNNNGYDYIAYINTPNSTQFLFKVEDNIIEEVWIA
ncbi:hypothetical protein [Fusobacterium varium]